MDLGANTNRCSMLLSMLKDVAILRKRLCNFSAACRCPSFSNDEFGSRMTKHITASTSRSDSLLRSTRSSSQRHSGLAVLSIREDRVAKVYAIRYSRGKPCCSNLNRGYGLGHKTLSSAGGSINIQIKIAEHVGSERQWLAGRVLAYIQNAPFLA